MVYMLITDIPDIVWDYLSRKEVAFDSLQQLIHARRSQGTEMRYQVHICLHESKRFQQLLVEREKYFISVKGYYCKQKISVLCHGTINLWIDTELQQRVRKNY